MTIAVDLGHKATEQTKKFSCRKNMFAGNPDSAKPL